MTSFPGSPKLIKGAIVALDPLSPLPDVVVFQYNPKTLSRSLSAQMTGGESGEKAQPMRFKGPPQEKITLKAQIDATDQLERAEVVATRMGIYPQLSALETLIYPKSSLVITNTLLADLGTLEIIPPEAPLTLFIWGARRVVPVKIESFSIEEQEYDVVLNPIRANVSLSLRILNYSDLSQTNPGYYLFLAHQIVKETMATMSTTSDLSSIIGGNVNMWR